MAPLGTGGPRRWRRGPLRTAEFWADAAERAIRASAASALSVLGANDLGMIKLADGRLALTVAAGAAALSLLMSVAASGVGDRRSAGFLTGTIGPSEPDR